MNKPEGRARSEKKRTIEIRTATITITAVRTPSYQLDYGRNSDHPNEVIYIKLKLKVAKKLVYNPQSYSNAARSLAPAAETFRHGRVVGVLRMLFCGFQRVKISRG